MRAAYALPKIHCVRSVLRLRQTGIARGESGDQNIIVITARQPVRDSIPQQRIAAGAAQSALECAERAEHQRKMRIHRLNESRSEIQYDICK